MKAMRSPIWAALAALAYGLALPSILISDEVRTYMMSAFLVQVSFYYFLDMVSMRSRILFAVTAALACLTEYYALIYVGAVLLFSLRPQIRMLLRVLATFALILALPVWEYLSHFGTRSVAYDHLPDFYFQPDSAESAIGFLLRNLRNELNCFSPLPVPDGATFYVVLTALVIAAGVTGFLVRKNRAALVSLLLPFVMMSAIMFGAVIRAYPFGGFLRQQYVLFPFLVVCPLLLLDRLIAGVPRTAIAGLLAIGVAIVSFQNYQAWPKSSQLLLSDQMGRYNRLFPDSSGNLHRSVQSDHLLHAPPQLEMGFRRAYSRQRHRGCLQAQPGQPIDFDVPRQGPLESRSPRSSSLQPDGPGDAQLAHIFHDNLLPGSASRQNTDRGTSNCLSCPRRRIERCRESLRANPGPR